MVGRLLEEAGGRRPVCFGTPFEAAVWAVLSQRVSMAQAGRVKEALAAALGHADGDRRRGGHRLPGPGGARVARGVPGRLGLEARAHPRARRGGAAGDLDPALLRSLDLDAAIAHLESLPGIGPFGAMLVLARGAGHPDVPPPTLRRFRQAVASAYGLVDEPDEAKLAELSEAWRPYRAWVTYLLRSTNPA